ncbi:MAG: four helix bundle protein [Bacteroidota bacterium]|nr:four helix bundle protein [Bacteroidota bacterium]
MAERKKPYDLRERLLLFGKRMLEICKKLPNYPECSRIRGQLGACGTSTGANYEEADGAITKKDFINKLAIARKEAKEARYFLRVISGTYLASEELKDDIKEAEEIINIMSSMINKSTGGKRS